MSVFCEWEMGTMMKHVTNLVGKMVIPIDSCEFFFSVAPARDSDLKIMIGRKATTYDRF